MRRHRHDDEDRILKDGQRLRVPMMMMDHLMPLQRAVAQSSTRVTDSQGGIVGLHRPGFRIAAQDSPVHDASYAAYLAYDQDLTNRWCRPHADECPICNGDGSVPSDYEQTEDEVPENTSTQHEGLGHNRRRVDHRTVAQMMYDHQNKMTDIYDKLDHELSEAWRRS